MYKDKYITYKNLKIGQEIIGYKLGNLTSSFKATVTHINSAYVTVLMWGKYEEQINSISFFRVEMSKQEFEDKYREKAKEVIKNITNKLHHDEIGYHEMWNSWLYGTPYEIASYCIEDKIKVVGYCSDIIPKTSLFSGDILDIGVCAEHEDGERFWCHFKYSDIEKMLSKYKYLL